MQLFHLGRQDRPAAAAENLDVRAALGQEVDHVLEVLDVPALVGRDCDALGVLLDCTIHNLRDGAVVAEVDDLSARGLHDAAHDVDGRVVTIKERCCGDDSYVLGRLVHGRLRSAICHGGEP